MAGITPASLSAEAATGTVKISSVMDLVSETYHLIDGLNEFRIFGIDLTVPDGEDESLALVAADGTTKVADITVVSTEDGQRIVCTLASAVPAGTYYVRLVSHGLDPTAPLSAVLHKVTVKAAETPPEPDPIAQSEDGTVKVLSLSDGGQSATFTAGREWAMTGEGLFTEAAAGRRWRIARIAVDDLGEYPAVGVDVAASGDGKSATLAAGGELPPAGTYASAKLLVSLENESDPGDVDSFAIPITFVVGA